MPRPDDAKKNPFRCQACGRYFESQEAFDAHARECEAIKSTGSGDATTRKGNLEEGPDREWVSTP